MKSYAVHPGPVVHVPPRALAERITFERLRTCVEIPEVTSSEMPLAGSIREWARVHVPVAFHEGALWTALRDAYQEPVSTSGLADILAGGVGGDALLPENLFLSPFHLPVPGSTDRTMRGTAIEPTRIGRVASDHRDAAQVAVRLFTADSLRIRDGKPWVRIPGPFLIPDVYAAKPIYRLTTRPYAKANGVTTSWLCPHEDMAAFHARRMGAARAQAVLRSHNVKVPLPPSREETLRFAANRGLVYAHREINQLLKCGELPEESIAAVRAAEGRLTPYLPLASISAIPASEAAGPILATNAAIAEVAALSPRQTWFVSEAGWWAAAFIPRLEAAVPDEDVDALSDLGSPVVQ